MLATEIDPDGIATLRLDQPERRNALSIAMRDAISDTLDEWEVCPEEPSKAAMPTASSEPHTKDVPTGG